MLLVDLLDEEIETIRALIEQYDAKIAILEEQQVNQATQVNAKGNRVPFGQVKLTSDAQETLDFYQFRMDAETISEDDLMISQT